MENRRLGSKPLRMGFAGLGLLMAVTTTLAAVDFLPSLKVGSEVYSNVTVTRVTVTDIYFKHSQGMGNAKLKNLGVEEQKHFRFDAAKSREAEQLQALATQRYHQEIAARKPAPKTDATAGEGAAPVTDDDGDPVVTKLYAHSFRGQRTPRIIVQEWLTPAPDVKDKWVLVEFWATSSEPCRQSVPHLNALQAKFKDRLIVIGLSDETPDDMRKMASPQVDYYVGTDPQARTRTAVELQGIPHSMLMDPKGIVRFEGLPVYLDEDRLERLMTKYSK
jgi:cytochrome c biogenesis protein CcmG, thiol:disulfide interchange protein DsbE